MSNTETATYPEKALAWITAQIGSGKTVRLTTATKVVSISPSSYKSWSESGHQLFKIDSSGLRVASGKRFDLVTNNVSALCKISAV
jgi:hypothetical protein